ncbi:MAG: hypothetical protein ABI671_19570 [Burkholderiales bacterium]
MKRTFLQKLVASTVLIGAVLGTASVAQARPDVHVSIALPGLPGLPVFLQPPLPRLSVRAEPVYVQPRPVYRAAPVVVYQQPWQPAYRHETWRARELRQREWQRREWERRHHGGHGSPHGERHGRD